MAGAKVLPMGHLQRMSESELTKYASAVERDLAAPATPGYLKKQYEAVLGKIKAIRSGATPEQAEWANEKPHRDEATAALTALASSLEAAGMKHSLSIPAAPATASAELSPLSALAAAFASAGVAYVAVGVPAPKTASVATASGDGKRISVTYERWDDEALDAGDTDDRGYEDEEGVKFEDDEFDGTAVEQAVRYLQHKGATEPSSSHFDSRVWYNSYGERDFRTGEIENKGYHLNEGWTDEEKQQIFNAITGKSATASHEVVAFGTASVNDAALSKINANLPFKAAKGNVSGTPEFKGKGWAENGPARDEIDTALHANPEYWLYSYATPIGVKIDGQWYSFSAKYTSTTTRHQRILWQLKAKPFTEFDPHGAPGSQTGGLGLF